MKTVKWIILTIYVLICFVAAAQQQTTTNSNQQKAEQARANDRPAAGEQTPGDSATTVGGPDANQNKAGAQSTAQQQNETGDSGTTNPAASNTPAVSQTTSSQSGSPAVLAEEDGKMRDGTNNIQRATMNMAGSPVDNVNLKEGNVNPNTEIAESQRQSGNRSVTPQKQNQKLVNAGTATKGSGAQGANDNNRRQNDEASDQTNSRSEKSQKSGQSKRSKERKRKDKG
jgi:hypothetical protein